MTDLKESLLEKRMYGVEDENETQSFLGVASADRAGTNSLNNLVENSNRKESDMNRSSQLEKSDISYDPDIHTQSYMTITEEVKAHRIHREVILVTTAIFMSYSSLVVLQKKLYDKVEANHADGSLTSYQKQLFEHGTSLVYFGNLLFRLLHNMLLGFLTPRNRVVVSLLCGTTSMFLLCFFYFWLEVTSVAWVYVAYLIGGVGIGSFEANILSTITPLGPDTKVWAIIGMPFGFTMISVVGYAIMGAFNISVSCLYIFTGCCCVVSVWIWLAFIPIPSAYNQQTPRSFVEHLQKWREWLPLIVQNCLALCVDMFFVSAFSAMNQFVLSDDTVPLLGHLKIDAAHMSFDDFMVVYSLCTFIGDTGGRKVVYWWDLKNNPLWFLLFSFAGGILCVVKIPLLMWLGGFAIFFANGLIYAATTKRIDASVERIFNLTSLSVWLFVGDVGSVTGSNTWEILEPLVCANEKHSRYFCTS